MAENDKIIKRYLDRLRNYYRQPSVGELMLMVSYLLKYTRMTQLELAKAVHCSQTTISQIMYLVHNAIPEDYTGENENKSVISVYLRVQKRVRNDPLSFDQYP
jgi:hypothetical protein